VAATEACRRRYTFGETPGGGVWIIQKWYPSTDDGRHFGKTVLGNSYRIRSRKAGKTICGLSYAI
jgi:hypothetical protein